MKVVVIVEGPTEKALRNQLRNFLKDLPALKLAFDPCRGLLPKGPFLKQRVYDHLQEPRDPADYVVALTDVYTGVARLFQDAADAKQKMRNWVGADERFFPHAAQYEFEAWLLPYWDRIQKLSGTNRAAPAAPERVNHNRPPSRLLKEVFFNGGRGRSYKAGPRVEDP